MPYRYNPLMVKVLLENVVKGDGTPEEYEHASVEIARVSTDPSLKPELKAQLDLLVSHLKQSADSRRSQRKQAAEFLRELGMWPKAPSSEGPKGEPIKTGP